MFRSLRSHLFTFWKYTLQFSSGLAWASRATLTNQHHGWTRLVLQLISVQTALSEAFKNTCFKALNFSKLQFPPSHLKKHVAFSSVLVDSAPFFLLFCLQALHQNLENLKPKMRGSKIDRKGREAPVTSTVRESSGSKQVHTLPPCCLLF